MLMQRPLAQVNWVRGKQVGYAEAGCKENNISPSHCLDPDRVKCVEVQKYGADDSPQESGSSERSPQSSSRSHVQEMGMQRPLAQGYWFGGHVRAASTLQRINQ